MIARLLLVAAFVLSATTASAQPQTGWREQVRQFAEANLKHPAWGYSHAVRDYELARTLANSDHVKFDDDVLFAAAMLHDVAAFPAYAKKDVDHADRAVEVVGDLLKGTGFPMDKLPAVQSAIRTHMFSRDPVGSEAIYLHDADALDWLGAIGVARLTATVDPTGASGGAPNGAAVVQALRANLDAVPSRVISKAGKALVPERSAFLKQYLEVLASETDDFKAL